MNDFVPYTISSFILIYLNTHFKIIANSIMQVANGPLNKVMEVITIV